jgi:sortase A
VNGHVRRIAGGCSAFVGAALLVCAASLTVRGWIWQERHANLFPGVDAPSERDAAVSRASRADRPPLRGEAVLRLRVPRLGIETVVVEGTDLRSLSLGPGHLEGSALPGQPDNCIIAGHRDGPLGRLRSARPGDVVEVADSAGVRRYRVESTDVAAKDDAQALAPSRVSLLTLVTCYPFNSVGPARQRFIVRAALLD